MVQDLKICEIDKELVAKLKKFRFRKEKTIGAISMKILPDKLEVVVDEEYEDMTFEEILEDLPEHQPRYVAISYVYNHSDGRVSYPLIFLFLSPLGSKPELHMMYAGSKLAVVNELGISKVFEERNKEDLDEEWLKEKLAFFR